MPGSFKISLFEEPDLINLSGPATSRGQALLESLFVLPFVFVVFFSLVLGFHRFGSYYLSDHWTYQSALCLAREEDSVFCKNQLGKRLNLIPFFHFSITEFHKNEKQVRIRLKTITPLLPDREIFEELRLPVKIDDLRGTYEK